MPDLAGRGALGQKAEKQPAKARSPIPKQSAKRKAYMRSDARKQGLEHMARVAQERCLICGALGVEVHHEGFPRSDMNVLPLCARHHRREYGPGAYHYSPKAFYALHGSSDDLLARVAAMLKTP
jgi:hypothetical protein